MHVPNVPFLYLLITSENRGEVEKGSTGKKWVNTLKAFKKAFPKLLRLTHFRPMFPFHTPKVRKPPVI